jgi:hypothetical protein
MGIGLAREGLKANDLLEVDGVIELPVTYFEQLRFGDWRLRQFLDVESTSIAEMESVLDQLAASGACAVTVVMHSFSFSRKGRPDDRAVEKFREFLKLTANRREWELVTTRDFYERHTSGNLNCSANPQFVPYTGFALTYARSWSRFFDGWRNAAFALTPGLLFAGLGAAAWLWTRKRRRATGDANAL